MPVIKKPEGLFRALPAKLATNVRWHQPLVQSIYQPNLNKSMKIFSGYGHYHAKEKQRLLAWFSGLDPAIKRKVIMRINFLAFFVFTCMLNVSATTFAQSITATFRNVPLKQVLAEINKQSGYELIYNNKHFVGTHNVTASIKDKSLLQALDICFEDQPISYLIIDKTIVLKPKPASIKDKILGFIKKITVTGQVVNDIGLPLQGATIKVKDRDIQTITDDQGNYTIEVEDNNAVLQVSYIGYLSKEVPVSKAKLITLIRNESRLDEVQVIAYGTTTRRLNTGSVSTIKAADIETQPVSNPLAALQGRLPGLMITQSSGVSGASFKVQIRGQSSLDLALSKNDPLFIIDGVPFEAGNGVTNQVLSAANNPVSVSSGGLSPFNTINPQDIESIDVLKDADATSIYGSRGANGVIMITTKKGLAGTTKFNVNVYSGISRVGKTMDMLGLGQYLAMRKEAFANDKLIPASEPSDPGYAPDIMSWDTTRYTDFKKLLIGKIAYSTNMQASVSGGSVNTQFRIGGNYHKETSVFAGNFSDNIASLNFNLNHSAANKKFNLQLSGFYSHDNNKLPRTDLTKYINLPPNLRLYDGSGKLAWDEVGVTFASLNLTNPLAGLKNEYNSINENLSGNLNLSYKILSGLSARLNLGYNTFTTSEKGLNPSASIDPNSADLPSASFASSANRNWIVVPQVEYNRGLLHGKLNLIIGGTFQEKTGSSNSMDGTNYASDLLLNSIDAAGNIAASNEQLQYRYAAFFGRVTYNYQYKYIANISARRDGSSRFGPDRQWANFMAVGLAWIFTNEAFFKDHLQFVSFGKLRGSYGTTGNDQIGDYKFLNLWRNTSQPYTGIPGLFPSSLYNPDYNWEVNKKLEAAIDLGFINDRFLLSLAYYRNHCSNQLIRYVLPGQTGFTNVVRNFPGLVRNSGLEVTVTTRNLNAKDWKWTTSFNVSVPSNKLVSFPGLASSSYKNNYVEGKSLSIIRAYKYLGIDPHTGLYTFEDFDGDGVIFNGDQQYFGNRDPKFYGGIQNNISFKNFDLSFFLQFTKQLGSNYISQLASGRPGTLINQPSVVLNRWRSPGDQTDVQQFSAVFDGPNYTANTLLSLSNGAYTDASFIKLKNVSLGYRLPRAWMDKFKVASCRIYLEMQNLLTITSYKGADPETQNFYALPPLKTVVAGVQLNF
jgi:TonB-linked SusC/RagA family outer membrane protein